jgi:hypothetical protein
MSERPEPIPIRSFRSVFRIERRLFRLGPWRLPLPYGLPLAGAGWAGALALTILVIGRLPLLGAPLRALPLPARLVVLPALLAWALLRLRPDGRPLQVAISARVRRRLGPRRIAAFRRAPRPGRAVRLADLTFAPDALGPALARAVLRLPRRATEPVVLTLRYPAAARGRGRTLHLRQLSDQPLWRGTQATLRPGQRLVCEGTEPG